MSAPLARGGTVTGRWPTGDYIDKSFFAQVALFLVHRLSLLKVPFLNEGFKKWVRFCFSLPFSYFLRLN